MKTYAAVLTMLLAEVFTMVLLWTCTKMEIFSICFWAILMAFLSLYIFALVTEPKKKRTAEWHKIGGLDVMVQGRR